MYFAVVDPLVIAETVDLFQVRQNGLVVVRGVLLGRFVAAVGVVHVVLVAQQFLSDAHQRIRSKI